MQIIILKAAHGDSFLLDYGTERIYLLARQGIQPVRQQKNVNPFISSISPNILTILNSFLKEKSESPPTRTLTVPTELFDRFRNK